METVTDFIFLGSKITADGDCCKGIKRRLLLGRKAMTNLDSILKSRHITLPTKVCLVKAMVFPVVMYGCESWTIKKAEHWRIDAFELWCWRRLLSLLDSMGIKPVNPKANQPWIFAGRTDAEAEAPILWLPDGKSRLTGNDPGGEWDDRGWDGWMASPTQWTWVWANSCFHKQGDCEGQGSLVCCSQWSPKAVLDTSEQLNNSNKVALPVSSRDGTRTWLLHSQSNSLSTALNSLSWKWKWSRSVVSDSLQPHGL